LKLFEREVQLQPQNHLQRVGVLLNSVGPKVAIEDSESPLNSSFGSLGNGAFGC